MRRIDVVSLRMVRERTVPYATSNSLRSAPEVHDLFGHLIGSADREAFWVMCLDSKARLCCLSQVSVGTLNATQVHPREVFKVALLSNAASVITIHNHPSGDVSPSFEDRMVTDQLHKSALILGLKFHDHIIVSDTEYFSFAESAML